MTEGKDELWRRRFQLFALVRLFGLGTFLFGIAVAFTGLVRPGGWPLAGGLIAIAGALDAVIAPRLLKKMWRQQDANAADHPGDGPNGA